MKETMGEKPRLLIYDLDGCVIDSSVRLARTVDVVALERGDFQAYANSFRRYHESVEGDESIPVGITLVAALRTALRVDRTVALTARGGESRALTLGQLQSYMPWKVEDADLLMRPSWPADSEGNVWRPGMPKFNAVEYKRGVVEKLQESYEVVCAIDDHELIIGMYRTLGITAILLQHADIDCLSAAGDRVRDSSIEDSSIEDSSEGN